MKKAFITFIFATFVNSASAQTIHPSCNQAFSELEEFFNSLAVNGKPLTKEQIGNELSKVQSQMPSNISNQEHYCSGIIFGVQNLKQQAMETENSENKKNIGK